MPTLPTLTVTEDQKSRILAAFAAKFGTTTPSETIAAFRKWHEQQVVEVVVGYETEQLRATAEATLAEQIVAVRDALPGPPPTPELTEEEIARNQRIADQLDDMNPQTPPHPFQIPGPPPAPEETP